MTPLPVSSFRLQNFKAVRDSRTVRFGRLTVLIGDNGSGKSSLIEGLETFRDIVRVDLDTAMGRWRGFEQVWNRASRHQFHQPVGHRPNHENAMAFHVATMMDRKTVRIEQQVNLGEEGSSLFIQHEQAVIRGQHGWERRTRDDQGNVSRVEGGTAEPVLQLRDGTSMFKGLIGEDLEKWQFLSLGPEVMGQPFPQQRAVGRVRLARNGANVAEYLYDILKTDSAAFDGILEALRCILPYAANLQPALASELERAFYLKLNEQDFEVPGWLLSTGTLRIVALLACLRHPKPPTLLVVEEVENGLDPRTLHLLVEEIRAAIDARTTQVILTTHSPYLLDLLDLSHIVVVEREKGQPVFRRPDTEQLAQWAKSFAPGQLYTMGRLTRAKP